ncbi:hypothetical protein [Moorena sp. SIO4G3]|nr:hypothetical protein [Moorena sp. SIO4G3]
MSDCIKTGVGSGKKSSLSVYCVPASLTKSDRLSIGIRDRF